MPTDVIIEPSSGQIYWNDSGAIGASQSIAIAGNAQDQIRILGYGFIYTLGGNIGASTERVVFNDSLTSTIRPGANGSGLGDATYSWDLYANNSYFRQPALFQSTSNSTSLFSGSIQSNGGIGISGNASIGQSLNIFNSTDGRYFVGFRAASGLAATNLYTLPTGYPGTGTSVLQSDTSGNLSWTSVLTAGGSVGSATTARNIDVSGSATSNFEHRVIFTTATTSVAGAALSQNSTLSYNPSTDILSASGILVTSGPSATNTTSGALQVRGGIGATGTSFFQTISVASLTGTGNVVINGNFEFKGLGTFGDNAQLDTINLNARFADAIAPSVNNTYDLGAVGLGATGPLMWKNIYAATGISAPIFTGVASTSQALSIVTATTNASHPILFTPATTAVVGAAISTVSTVSINPSNSTITATTFSGAFSGNVTGTATTSQNTTVVFSNTPATNHYLTFIPQGSSVAGAAVSAVTTIFATPSTGNVTATTFSGTLSGYATTGRNVDIQLATTNAIHAVTFTPQLTAVVGSATSSDNMLVYNPSTKILTTSGLAVTALTETTSATTGALLVTGSAGIARSLSVGTSVIFWNGANYSAFKSGATSTQIYTLPTGYPGTGISVLASDTSGTLTWVASSGGGGGSGTTSLNVNVTSASTNAVHRILFTPATTTVAGAGISLSGGISFNPATDILTTSGLAVTALTAAGSTSTGALIVTGGAGIGGSLWVGGPVSVGGTLDYATTNMIANFTGNANGYTQVIAHNHNSGNSASTDFIVSNDSATDTTFYGDFGMNSSGWASTTQGLATANTVYLAAASGDLALGTFTANALRVTIGSSSLDSIYINSSGTAISINPNIDLRSAQSIRFLNSGNTFFTGVRAGANAANYTLTLPTAVPGAGTSVLVSDSTGAMAFVPFVGLGVSTGASNNALIVTHLEPFMVTFCSGYTPTATGADTVVFRFPESTTDGTTSLTYQLRRVQMRVETLSSGTSTIRLEKYGWAAGVGTGAFSTSSTGSTANVLAVPLNIGGAGMGETFATSASIGFSGNGTTFVSGDKLRVNFTALNATHANFTITALVDLIS